MKVFKTIEEVATGLGVKSWEVQKAYDSTFHRGSFFIEEKNIIIQTGGKKLLFIELDRKNDADCKKYFMQYEKDLYNFKVYVDDIEKWQEVEIKDVRNTRMNIERATVVTKNGTKLNRVCKFLINYEIDEEFKADGCIYFWEKEDDCKCL